MVVPVTEAGLHDGTLVVPFADISGARVARDGTGRALIERHVPLQRSILSAFGGGQSTYHELDLGGVLMPQLHTSPPPFRIYATGISLGQPPAPSAGG